MSKESTNIWDRLFIRIKNGVDKFLYYDNLFDDNVWNIRFSKDKKQKIKYKIEKSQFDLSLKSGDDVFKYLWMTLLVVSLVWMLVLSRHIGISDREIATGVMPFSRKTRTASSRASQSVGSGAPYFSNRSV